MPNYRTLAFLAIAFLTPALAGCAGPTATLTPATTATSAPTYTPTSAPTDAPPQADSTGPTTIAMSLEDAKQTVIEWLDPSREPRIDQAFYVSEHAFAEVAPDGMLLIEPTWDMMMDHWTADASSERPLVIVLASTRGMEILHPRYVGLQREGGDLCLPGTAQSREKILAMFDAQTGHLIGAAPEGGSLSDDQVGRLGRQASPVVTIDKNAFKSTPTPPAETPAEPTPTDTPGLPSDADPPLPLGEGQVPRALAEVAHKAPFINGAWWSYRSTFREHGFRWTTSVYTTTVDTSLQIAPDVMVSRVGPNWRYVFPDGVIDTIGDLSLAELRRGLAPGGKLDTTFEMQGPQLRFPLRAGDKYSNWINVEQEVSVTVPAGTFENCYVITYLINAGNTNATWFCPGVGQVRFEGPGCSTMWGSYNVTELLDYHIPPIVPRP